MCAEAKPFLQWLFAATDPVVLAVDMASFPKHVFLLFDTDQAASSFLQQNKHNIFWNKSPLALNMAKQTHGTGGAVEWNPALKQHKVSESNEMAKELLLCKVSLADCAAVNAQLAKELLHCKSTLGECLAENTRLAAENNKLAQCKASVGECLAENTRLAAENAQLVDEHGQLQVKHKDLQLSLTDLMAHNKKLQDLQQQYVLSCQVHEQKRATITKLATQIIDTVMAS